jgi:glycosyltransferase involved in cell wall biosynthesis
MKIIEIGTGYTPIPAEIGAATEIVIENLLREFNALEIECELLDITYEKGDSYINGLLHGAIVNRVYLSRWLSAIKDYGFIHYLRRVVYSFKVAFRLKKILKVDKGNTYIHFHNQFNYFIVYLFANKIIKKAKTKTIYTIHSPNWLLVEKVPKRSILEKRTIENCDYVIALTEKIKTKIYYLIPSIDRKKINVIPNGVSSHFYHVISDCIKDNTIVNVGTVCERKNQLSTISYLKEFLKQHNFKFKFAGKIAEPEYFEKINQYIASNELKDYVEYVGELKPGNELNAFYNKSFYEKGKFKQ